MRSHVNDPHSSSVGGGNAPFCLFANCHKKPEEGPTVFFFKCIIFYVCIFFFYIIQIQTFKANVSIIHLFFFRVDTVFKERITTSLKKKVRVLI